MLLKVWSPRRGYQYGEKKERDSKRREGEREREIKRDRERKRLHIFRC